MRKNDGWSTLELLVALGIITAVLVPVTQVVLGNTEFAKDTRFSQAALVMADKHMQIAGSEIHADWESATEYTAVADDMYEKSLAVSDISECLKEVSSRLDWDNSPVRPQATGITTLVTNPDTVRKLMGNCNTTPPSGGWDNPTSYGAIDFAPSGGKALDIDVVHRGSERIAFVSSYYSATSKPDLMVIDVSVPGTPVLLSSVDLGVTLNAIVVAGDYLYGAADRDSGQLVVVNVSDLLAPVLETSFTLPDSVVPFVARAFSIMTLSSLHFLLIETKWLLFHNPLLAQRVLWLFLHYLKSFRKLMRQDVNFCLQ